MLALCVENASLSPPLLLRTCALTLVSGLFGVPSVEGHLPKGEVKSTNFVRFVRLLICFQWVLRFFFEEFAST